MFIQRAVVAEHKPHIPFLVKNMPVKNCEDNKKPGFKWGDSGKCYTYDPKNETAKKTAKKSAILQGLVIGDYKNTSKHPKSNK
jgi:hypothetical protein